MKEKRQWLNNDEIATVNRIKASPVREMILEHPDVSVQEYRAIEGALEAGMAYGYGNVISWLATEWALRLVQEGMSREAAIEHVSSRAPYSLPEIE